MFAKCPETTQFWNINFRLRHLRFQIPTVWRLIKWRILTIKKYWKSFLQQTCSLKNKGKYEISFKFTLEDAHGKHLGEPLEDLFKIQPACGTLTPIDRPTQVQVQFNTTSEVQISEVPILKCHVIEPNMSDSGEIIGKIQKYTSSCQKIFEVAKIPKPGT